MASELDVLDLMCEPGSPKSPTPPPTPTEGVEAGEALGTGWTAMSPHRSSGARRSTERLLEREEPSVRSVAVDASADRGHRRSPREKRRCKEAGSQRDRPRKRTTRSTERDTTPNVWKRPKLQAADRTGEDPRDRMDPTREEGWKPSFAGRYFPARRPNGYQKKQQRVPQVFFHKRGMAVVCIKQWGYTLTNGVVSHSVDHDPHYGTKLLESMATFHVDRLYVTDEESQVRWECLVRAQYQYHPAQQVQVARIPASEHAGICVFCGQADCHRWLAVVGGISKWVHHPVEPIRHG